MKLTSLVALAVVPAWIGACPVGAQQRIRPEIVVGSQVRFFDEIVQARREGRVLSRTDSAMLVRLGSRENTREVALASLRELSMGVPRSSGAGAARGAGRGFVAGIILAGAVLGISLASDCNDCPGGAAGTGLIVGGLGAGIFTVLGAIFGSMSPGFDWEPVERGSTPPPGQAYAARLASPR